MIEVRSNREKYNISFFFSGVLGIYLRFEQINDFRVVYVVSLTSMCIRLIS